MKKCFALGGKRSSSSAPLGRSTLTPSSASEGVLSQPSLPQSMKMCGFGYQHSIEELFSAEQAPRCDVRGVTHPDSASVTSGMQWLPRARHGTQLTLVIDWQEELWRRS